MVSQRPSESEESLIEYTGSSFPKRQQRSTHRSVNTLSKRDRPERKKAYSLVSIMVMLIIFFLLSTILYSARVCADLYVRPSCSPLTTPRPGAYRFLGHRPSHPQGLSRQSAVHDILARRWRGPFAGYH